MASDAELIERSLLGTQAALVEVVLRHEVAVGAYLVRRVGRGWAEDLLGEVWTAAYASRHTYDRAYADARPWLFGIAHNTLRRHWRSRPVEDLYADVATVSSSDDPWQRVDERVDGGTSVREALAHLDAQQRAVLTLVVWEELSIADAARVLEMPAGTARYLMHQARLTLRSQPSMVALLNQANKVKETR